jgi:hypothetical protein
MIARIFLLLLTASMLAGCGGSSEDAEAKARAAEEARQRRLEEETEKALASARDLDDLRKELAPDLVAEKGASETASADAGEEGPLRNWTDPAGRTLVRAEFVSILEGKVCLQKEDGSAAVIPLDELSQKDRDYAKSQAGEELSEQDPQGELVAQADVLVEEGGDGESAAEAVGMESEEVAEADPARRQYTTARRQKVVIPFDFVSQFDEGRYGQMVGDQIWKKLEREGGFIIPDSMFDVRDLCAAKGCKITPTSSLDEVAEVVRRDFDADVGIWGSVERAPGAEWEIYDLVIKCVDFSQPEPKVVYEVTARTNSVSEIPHLYVKQMLDKLYDRKPGGPPPVDQLAEENWKNNPNLVEGGDFQKGAGGVPLGWESAGGQFREPLGGLVKWIPENGNGYNKVIRFTFDKGVGDGYGVMYYSKPFPVEEGAKYRFQCRWRSNGPNVKVFIKCYDQMASEYTPDATPVPSARRGSYVPESSQLRECYRSQQNLYGPKNTWNVQTQDFTPKHTKYTPRWGKVMLYAYLGAGVVEFDDVVLKQIVPASPSDSKKDRRHSMESDVTLKEMEENERRGAEARERLRQEVEP